MIRIRLADVVTLVGVGAFVLALLSIVDILVPRPYDGVVLEADARGELEVREVLAGSGAERAGIQAGDRIAGIDRELLRSSTHAGQLLSTHGIGDEVPYLVRRGPLVQEVGVRLGRRFLGKASYFFACLLGFAFFGVGLFVRARQPDRRPAQVFFLLGALFLLFLVCRLRPASYGLLDTFFLDVGALALLLLPACFLHFFLIYPRPVALRPRGDEPDAARRRRRWRLLLTGLYLLPVVVPLIAVPVSAWTGHETRWISGAPAASWWVLGLYMLLGLAVLALNSRRIEDVRQRRGAALVRVGALFGLLPFLAIALLRPEWLHSEPEAFLALVPLALVPVTFAIAIVRFGLLDVRVMLRRSLVYSAVTVMVAAVYATLLAVVNAFALGSELAASPWFPILFALGVLLLLEPLRLRGQASVDRFVHADRRRLQTAVKELGRAIAAEVDPQPVVRELVERLPRLLGLHFAALYLVREGVLAREAGPERLPAELPLLDPLHRALAGRGRLVRVDALAALAPEAPEVEQLAAGLEAAGVELAGDLTSPRRRIGLLLLSGAAGQIALGDDELEILDSLLGQAAMAIETGLLVAERTRQAELERELEIASSVQAELLPRALSFGSGWRVAALCRPARHVGGDFFAELPVGDNGHRAVVYGDVAGKSVAGALVMMAAHEALQTLALTHRDPETLFQLANRRLYGLGTKKSFVALAWLAPSEDGRGLRYLLAGQPQLLVRGNDGAVRELPLPDHRLPLGALLEGRYALCTAPLAPGELVLGYSDGVVEAMSPAGEPFGDERLTALLARLDGDPDRVVAGVLEAVVEFTRGAEPYDDITLVALARDPEATR